MKKKSEKLSGLLTVRVLSAIIVLITVAGCGLNKDRLQAEGYQILEEYSIAIKAPCQFQIDSTLAIDSSFGNYVVMVCPQIFKDSSRRSFHLQRLLDSQNSIYHLKILQNASHKTTDFLIDQQKQIIEHFNASDIEETQVDGKTTLIYELKEKMVSEAYIPDNSFSYYIAVSSDSSRTRLNEILKNVKFGQFR